MNRQSILSMVDHTELKQTATFHDIKTLIDDAVKYKTASVCIPPCFVKEAVNYANSRIPVCTVIGFPNGYNTTAVKVFETEDAIKNGADEIDMVINIGELKNKNYDYIKNEIVSVKKACGEKILKVIIETCLLSDEEKKAMCRIIEESGADFIKTSTGFSISGATFDDVKLFSENVDKTVKIKAAGGISSFHDAEKFISLGADRLGTSRLVRIIKEDEKNV